MSTQSAGVKILYDNSYECIETYTDKAGLKLVTKVAGFDVLYVLEMKESNLVCKANRLLLVNYYDNKNVKSPYG